MARSVKILVVDQNGNGKCGIKVNEYNGDSQYTDDDGYAYLTIDGSSTTIYVNSYEAFDGSTSRLKSAETFDTCGRWITKPR